MAPSLASVRVYVGSVAEDVLDKMATDNISKVLSTSWGWGGNDFSATDHGYFLRFAAQGQTNLTASGDNSTLLDSGPWPDEDRAIVAVGGTDLSMSGNGAAWSGETGWADSAGGPSYDTTIRIAPYQLPYVTAANKASATLRNVPDIAASANLDMEICANGACQGGWGGTSFASPIWAGFIALTNQWALKHELPVVGFINPRVYALGRHVNYHSFFHDETSGASGLYSCTNSWDMVTGLGSPNGAELIHKLAE
jgi:kumamolisin